MAVAASLQIHTPKGSRLVALSGERFTVGTMAGNDLVLDDPSTSRLHLVCETAGPMWTVTDVGSTNGTWLNGSRLFGTHALRHGDRLGVGVVTLVYCLEGGRINVDTASLAPRPHLTRRERELLAELCRPVVAGNVLTEPASVREMALALSVSESAVKKALGRLYSKFDLYDGDRGRGKLAVAAIRSGMAQRLGS